MFFLRRYSKLHLPFASASEATQFPGPAPPLHPFKTQMSSLLTTGFVYSSITGARLPRHVCSPENGAWHAVRGTSWQTCTAGFLISLWCFFFGFQSRTTQISCPRVTRSRGHKLLLIPQSKWDDMLTAPWMCCAYMLCLCQSFPFINASKGCLGLSYPSAKFPSELPHEVAILLHTINSVVYTRWVPIMSTCKHRAPSLLAFAAYIGMVFVMPAIFSKIEESIHLGMTAVRACTQTFSWPAMSWFLSSDLCFQGHPRLCENHWFGGHPICMSPVFWNWI
jgi:hypothetical protein